MKEIKEGTVVKQAETTGGVHIIKISKGFWCLNDQK